MSNGQLTYIKQDKKCKEIRGRSYAAAGFSHVYYFHRFQNPIINMHSDTLRRPYMHCNEIILLVLENKNIKLK